MLDVGAYLDIVEVCLVDRVWHTKATTIPRHLELRIFFVNVLCQLVDTNGVGITVPYRQIKASIAFVSKGSPMSSQR